MEALKNKEVQIIQKLPYDIWNQILIRLPAKTVIVLKSVCKSLRELINNKNFQISHVDHRRIRVSADTTPSQDLLAIMWPSCIPTVLSIESVSDYDQLHCRPIRFDQLLRRLSGPTETTTVPSTIVYHGYDGLFIVQLVKRNQLLLCNPFTNSYLPLPSPPVEKYFITPNLWTIVYDSSTRQYVIFYVDQKSYRIEWVSSWINGVSSLRIDLNDGCGRKVGVWRHLSSLKNLAMFSGREYIHNIVARISINGKAHWLFEFGHRFRYMFEKTGILTIDAATEESIVTECSDTPSCRVNFCMSSRKFCCWKECSSRNGIQLWFIDDLDNPTWLEHREIIKMDFIERSRSFDIEIIKILEEGNRLIIRLRTYGTKLFIYDIDVRKWQTLDVVGIIGNKDAQKIWKLMPIHFSLLSLN